MIAGLAFGGEGVHIRPKTYAVSAKELKHLLIRKMLYPVESHVLKKMSQSVLIVFFLKRSNIMDNVEVSHSGGVGVMPDVVCQSVVECSCLDLSVHRQRLCGQTERTQRQCGRRDEKSF